MQLDISAENRDLLLGILQNTLGNTRTEARRTKTPSYKAGLKHEMASLRQLIDPLQHLEQLVEPA
jgi:hypothetical protein